MSTIDDDDIEVNPNSLHFILGELTAGLAALQVEVAELRIRLASLENKVWGMMGLIVISIGLQILFQVME